MFDIFFQKAFRIFSAASSLEVHYCFKENLQTLLKYYGYTLAKSLLSKDIVRIGLN